MSAIAQRKPAFEIAPPSPAEARVISQADVDSLQDELNQAEHVARQLQARVSAITGMGGSMTPEDSPAIALREARTRATELRTAFLEARAALYREELAAVAIKFSECAMAFGAEAGSNGWASCRDVPPEALAACFDPMIVAVAAREDSVPRVLNQLRHAVEGAVPPACSPFMPREIFDTSNPIRSAIVERIRTVVKDAENHSHKQ